MDEPKNTLEVIEALEKLSPEWYSKLNYYWATGQLKVMSGDNAHSIFTINGELICRLTSPTRINDVLLPMFYNLPFKRVDNGIWIKNPNPDPDYIVVENTFSPSLLREVHAMTYYDVPFWFKQSIGTTNRQLLMSAYIKIGYPSPQSLSIRYSPISAMVMVLRKKDDQYQQLGEYHYPSLTHIQIVNIIKEMLRQ